MGIIYFNYDNFPPVFDVAVVVVVLVAIWLHII